MITSPCDSCRGRGGVRRARQISVKIPAGVDDGQQVRLTGEGEVGDRGGQTGNLYVLLDVLPHETFERVDDHILYDLPLNLAQAALGTGLKIPTLEGDMDFEVPAGTQSGDEFVVRGQGVPRLNSSRRGDMIVRTTVVVPESLTEEQRELLQQLADTLGTPSLPSQHKSFLERLRDAVAG
ncbi:MAG: J domain-containing protein [Dehalococcoidia bacterium]|nr:J domain-containing protein [Dehalococcoidia bacterium]